MVDDNDIKGVYGLVISKERETNKKYNIDDMKQKRWCCFAPLLV